MKPRLSPHWKQAALIGVFGLFGAMAGVGVAMLAFGQLSVLDTDVGRWLIRDVLKQPAPTLPDGRRMVESGELIPAIALPDLSGENQPFAQWQGRPLLVNFWATWCPPCVREMPLLDDFARTQGETGVRVVGVALDDLADVKAFLAHHPVGFPVLIETNSKSDTSVLLGNRRGMLPYSVLIDAHGRLLRSKLGAFADDEIETFVRP